MKGLIIKGSGHVNGKGAIWWNIEDKFHCKAPWALHFHKCDNLQLSGFTSQDSPRNHIMIHQCTGVHISNVHLNAPANSPNTDGIDISLPSQIDIRDSSVGTGDDCIAIKGGSSFVNITNVACGPGHGISVGSLGQGGADDRVEQVHVQHCTFTNTQNGARIKTWKDRLVSLLIFSIVLSGLIDIGYSERTFDVLNYKAVGDGEADDSEAFVNAWKALCGADEVGDVPTLVIPKGKTFLVQPIEFEGPCRPKRVHIQVLGNVVAPKTVDAWKECPSSNTWLQFTNVANLILDGSGTIDGQGSPWWSNSIANQYISFLNVNEKSCESPKALHFNRCDNLRLSGLTHVNSPKAHIGISHCINVDVSHLTIIAPDESPNTDGIDISNSINVNIHDSFIGTGDDCIAINSGSSNINITNIACGPGHGISVGSLGKNGAHETVENVYVRDCSFNGTQNGARIKTWQGGSGYAKNIVFEKITLVAAENPIIIDQFYCDAKAKLSCDNQTSAVTVSNVRYIDFEGTSGSEEAITLNCNQIQGCQNIVMEEIHITSAVPSKKIYAGCSHAKGTCNDITEPICCLDK